MAKDKRLGGWTRVWIVISLLWVAMLASAFIIIGTDNHMPLQVIAILFSPLAALFAFGKVVYWIYKGFRG